jgi:RimJ/RimL family protein N-acetyltransferase
MHGARVMPLTIETPRLRLRQPTENDLSGYLAYRNAPCSDSPVGEDEARGFLQAQARMGPDDLGWRMFSIEHPDADALVGEVGVFIAAQDRRQGDMGWWLHPDHRGRGYATEAARALIDWCFAERHLHRLTANCLSANLASLTIMRRVGMRLEGQSLESRFVDGSWRDESRYALLHREWFLRTELSATSA